MKFIFVFVALSLFPGCTKPVVKAVEDDAVVEPVVIEPEKKPEDAVELPPVSVSAPQNVVDAVYQVLGDKGSLPPKDDLTVEATGTKVTIHPGSTLDYEFSGGSYLFSFNEPRPTVEASALGFKIHPPLLALRLFPDNTGLATVQTAFGKVNRKFAVAWEVPPGSPAIKIEPEDGVLRFHTMEGCGPCEIGKKALAEAKKAGKLPFEYEVTEDAVSFVDGRPVLTCKVDGVIYTPVYAADDPKTGAKKGDWRPGWYGVDDAISWWKQVPKPKK